ncbi:hypothetical protein BKA70DRAFT_1157711 [Coprinopsis sp. MPI-PUGE-AT-0042]|nr:hypothetical protein BKA70DRAFT_1157711 [Coprinopsis sp. MPI-PUGE-AT-0042]
MDVNARNPALYDAEIKSQRNRLAPICLLPVEIFCRILLYCKSGPWSKPTETTALTSPLEYFSAMITSMRNPPPIAGWTLVTHVCRHWRSVALGCAELWADLDGRLSSKWLEAMVERSANVPISINFRSSYRRDPRSLGILSTAISNPDRWRNVSIGYRNISTDPNINIPEKLGALRKPAPLLVRLSLAMDDSSSPDIYSLPEDFLQGSAPALRELELHRCFLPWQSNLFRRLTSLRLSFPRHLQAPITRPTPDRLAEILSLMPGLNELYLKIQVPDMCSGLPSNRAFHFRSLTSLRLVGATAELAGLLSRLRIPSSTKVDLQCVNADGTSIACVGSALRQALSTLPMILDVQIEGYEDRDNEDDGMTLRGYTERRDNHSIPAAITISALSFRESSGAAPPLPDLHPLLAVFPLDHLEAVEFTGSSVENSSKMNWPLIFEALEPVKQLTLLSIAVEEYMTATLHHPKNTADGTTHLPHLERIILKEMNGEYQEGREVVPDELITWLADCVTSRQAGQLKRLEFADPSATLSASQIKKLIEMDIDEILLTFSHGEQLELSKLLRGEGTTSGGEVPIIGGSDQ